MNQKQCDNLGGEWNNKECRIKREVIIGTDTLLACARGMVKDGIITEEQFTEMEQRAKNIPSYKRKDVITLREKER